MLDSNVIIAVSLAQGASLRRRIAEQDDGDFVMSSIGYAEVVHGSVRGRPPSFVGLDLLIEEVLVMPFDYAAARAYATIPFKRVSYEHLIAAHALSLGLTLVTDNVTHFTDVPGLKVENWTL